METFLECELPCVASHNLDTCSWKVRRKSIQGKWQKWCVVHVTKDRYGDPIGYRIIKNETAAKHKARLCVITQRADLISAERVSWNCVNVLRHTIHSKNGKCAASSSKRVAACPAQRLHLASLVPDSVLQRLFT